MAHPMDYTHIQGDQLLFSTIVAEDGEVIGGLSIVLHGVPLGNAVLSKDDARTIVDSLNAFINGELDDQDDDEEEL